MFNSKQQPSKELFETLQSTELTQRYIEQYGFNLKDLKIAKTRIQGIEIKGFSLTNMSLTNFDSRNSNLTNGAFKDIEFDDVYFNESTITNVTFENSNLTKANFFGVNFTNVKFINCKITKSTFFQLVDSDIEFINTKIYENEFKFSESHIQMRLINSKLKDTDMMSLKEGSSIYMENSEINTVNFQYSKLNFFKSVNSKMLNSTLGDSEINELSFDKTHIDISFGDAVIDKVTVTKSKIDNLGAIRVKAESFSISDCKEPADVSFAKSNIENITIINCDFKELHPANLKSNSLIIENTTIEDSIYYKSNIKNFSLTNVKFTKEADFTDFTAEKSVFENVTKGPNLKLIMDGANIEF